jgi:hypothetical protein
VFVEFFELVNGLGGQSTGQLKTGDSFFHILEQQSAAAISHHIIVSVLLIIKVPIANFLPVILDLLA